MSMDRCILTTKDFTILEVMLDRCLGRDDPLVPILRRKLEAAIVVLRDDVPASVATLSSRVTFSVGGRQSDTRVLSHDRMNSPGVFLPITTARGLALLGLSEGQRFRLRGSGGAEEDVLLESVLYQPEAARRRQETTLQPEPQRKPMLTLVQGGGQRTMDGAEGFDDPGPSAA